MVIYRQINDDHSGLSGPKAFSLCWSTPDFLYIFFIARQVQFFIVVPDTYFFFIVVPDKYGYFFFPEYIINSSVKQALLMLLTLLEMSFLLAFAHHNLSMAQSNGSLH